MVQILFDKEYFGFKINAQKYVSNLMDSIVENIAAKKHHKTTGNLRTYGNYYASFPLIKRTAWYVFFNKKNDRYIIKYIINNHGPKAGLLNLLK